MLFLEITGFLFGVAGVWLTIRKSIWCFPVGIVNVLITAWLVYSIALFADTLQQLVYFVLLLVGWVNWSRSGKTGQLVVSRLKTRNIIQLAFIFIAGTALMGFLFSNYSRASYPFWDSAATVICFIAQWMIAKRKIENWILWMVANPIYITLFLIKGLEWYALLSLIYFIMAVIGWNHWNRYYKMQTNAG